MRKTLSKNLVEFSSLGLILSYLFVHNIVPVLVGIALSLYLININFIHTLSRSVYEVVNYDKENKKDSKEYKAEKLNSKYVEANKIETERTLVESIEELGFIPSLEKNDDKNIA